MRITDMSEVAHYHPSQLNLGLKGADIDVELQVAIPASTLGAFARQVERRKKSASGGDWAELSAAFRAAIQRVLDDDLKEPTDRELRDAARWARERGLAIPLDAICYRGALRSFVDSIKRRG